MQALLHNPVSLFIIILFGSYLAIVYPFAIIIGQIYKAIKEGNPFQGAYIAWLFPVMVHLFAALTGLVMAIFGVAYASGPLAILVTFTKTWKIFSIAWFVVALGLDIFIFLSLWGSKKEIRYRSLNVT